MGRAERICHVFSTFAPGGVELRTATLINALGPRFAHTIVALDSDYRAAAKIDPAARVDLVSAVPRKRGILYPLAVRRMLDRIGPDLVVTYTWYAIHGLIAAQLGRRRPIVHVEAGFRSDEAAARKWRRVVVRRLLLRDAHATIVPSRSLERVALAEFRVPRHKLIHIPNGVDSARFRPRRDPTWRDLHRIPEDALVFGTVCQLRAEKNLPLLLRAFRRAGPPDARLVIVGDGPCRMEWEALARELGLGERAIFAGQTDDPATCYAGFDVFVMSSVTEQMPNALLEAMACGLPAICTDVGDSREMLGGAGPPAIVPPGDEAAYTAALGALAARPALRAALGAANRARCVERYSLAEMARRYAAVYDAAVGCSRWGVAQT